jgi:ATPase
MINYKLNGKITKKGMKFMPYAFVPDSSVMVNGKILELIQNNLLADYKPIAATYLKPTVQLEIVLSRVVLAEIENQANHNKATGTVGLETIQELFALMKAKKITTQVVGERPTLEQIRLNAGGELDALIRRDAADIGGILLTGDNVQANMALIEGLDVFYVVNVEAEQSHVKNLDNVPKLEEFFDDKTMSVHFVAHCPPLAKRGKPGAWKLEPINAAPMEPRVLEEIAAKLMTEAKNEENTFIEKDEQGVTVIQKNRYRIVICRPPFSNKIEITAVRPLVNLTLVDYRLPKEMYDRLEIAEGILVAGSPGAGKSTFISALTEYYRKKKKIIKTLESVRDLVVDKEVVQYSPFQGDMAKTADVLLLVRPDFTIFDEVRVDADFKVFGDMRLAGVGMVGVVHASKAVDAIQRFIRRVELGVIPNVIDTIIFIKDGRVEDVLSTQMVVKKPTGFTDRDLSRPVIEVRDFFSNELLYEIYAFGSDVVVAPVGRERAGRSGKRGRTFEDAWNTRKTGHSRLDRMAALRQALDDDENLNAEDEDQPSDSENEIDTPLWDEEGASGNSGEKIKVHLARRAKTLVISVGFKYANNYLHFYLPGQSTEWFGATVNKKGEVVMKRSSPYFAALDKMMRSNTRPYACLD